MASVQGPPIPRMFRAAQTLARDVRSAAAAAGREEGAEELRVNSPWFRTLLGPPVMAVCEWRWVFTEGGWMTQLHLVRGDRRVELEWEEKATEQEVAEAAEEAAVEQDGTDKSDEG
jgi:hypothetical protein